MRPLPRGAAGRQRGARATLPGRLRVAGRRALPLSLPPPLRVDQALVAEVATRVSDSLVVTDRQRRIVWVNDAFESLTGFRRAEALGQNPGRLLQCAGTDRATVEAMRAALDAGRPFAAEVLNRHRDGRDYWIELRIQPLLGAHGRLAGFMSRQTDITSRRVAEDALRHSRRLLDRTGALSGTGGFELDLASGRMAWTAQTQQLLGPAPPPGPTLERFLSHFEPALGEQVRARFAARLAPEGLWETEGPLRDAHGGHRRVRLVAECERVDGQAVRLLGALQDVTALHAMEAEIRRGAELLRNAIDAMDEAIVIFDADDRLLWCNDRYRAIYARSRDLLVPGMAFEDILRGGVARGQFPAAAGREEEWIARRLAAHRGGASTQVKSLDDGRVVRVVERRTPDGHRVGSRIDITDLVHATEAAEQAARAKGEFIATVSHELRTPLQTILGFSDLGRHFAAGQDRFVQMFEDIHAAGQRMLGLVNTLLDASKLDSTQDRLVLKPGDLGALAAEVARELAGLAAQRSLRIVLPQPLPRPVVAMDAFRIGQVIRNLLANAIRHAPAGSDIEVAIESDGIEGVELRVRDFGPGIPPGESERIFDAFVQSSRTRDGAGGTGLGLTISRKIVRAHGGRIEAVQPADGRPGACLLVWLALAPQAPDVAADVATDVASEVAHDAVAGAAVPRSDAPAGGPPEARPPRSLRRLRAATRETAITDVPEPLESRRP